MTLFANLLACLLLATITVTAQQGCTVQDTSNGNASVTGLTTTDDNGLTTVTCPSSGNCHIYLIKNCDTVICEAFACPNTRIVDATAVVCSGNNSCFNQMKIENTVAGTTHVYCNGGSLPSCQAFFGAILGTAEKPLGGVHCETQASCSFSVQRIFANCIECTDCTQACAYNFEPQGACGGTPQCADLVDTGRFQSNLLKVESDTTNEQVVAVFEHDDVTGVRTTVVGDAYGEVQIKFYTPDCAQEVTDDTSGVTIQAPSGNFFAISTGLTETPDATVELTTIADSVHTSVRIPYTTFTAIGTPSTNAQGDPEVSVCVRLQLTGSTPSANGDNDVFQTEDVVLTGTITTEGTVSLGAVGVVEPQEEAPAVLLTVLGAFSVAAFRCDLADPSTPLGSNTVINEGDFFSVCFKPQEELDNGDSVDTDALSVVSITTFSCKSTSAALVREQLIIADGDVVNAGATTTPDCTLTTGDPAGIGCGFSTTLDSGFFDSAAESDITISCEGVAVLEDGTRRFRRLLQVAISGSVSTGLSLMLAEEEVTTGGTCTGGCSFFDIFCWFRFLFCLLFGNLFGDIFG